MLSEVVQDFADQPNKENKSSLVSLILLRHKSTRPGFGIMLVRCLSTRVDSARWRVLYFWCTRMCIYVWVMIKPNFQKHLDDNWSVGP